LYQENASFGNATNILSVSVGGAVKPQFV
jgi:hypothetical protein